MERGSRGERMESIPRKGNSTCRDKKKYERVRGLSVVQYMALDYSVN